MYLNVFNMGKPLNSLIVFVFGDSSETVGGKKGGRMDLRGLPAFDQQVKRPDDEKAAEKLILVQRDSALIQASGGKEPGFASRLSVQQFTSLSPDNIKEHYETVHREIICSK